MGARGKMRAVDNLELTRLRSLEALQALYLLADHVKVDWSFRPTQDQATERVHVSAAGRDWELLLNGPKFFDTRVDKGGGGAIDLVMYLWGVPFKKAVAILKEAGV